MKSDPRFAEMFKNMQSGKAQPNADGTVDAEVV